MALLETLRHDFAEHDVFLHLLLGLVSLSRSHDAALPSPSVGPVESPPESDLGPEDRPVLLLLGLLSVRRTLMQGLEAHRVREEPPTRSSPVSSPAESPRLRDLLR